ERGCIAGRGLVGGRNREPDRYPGSHTTRVALHGRTHTRRVVRLVRGGCGGMLGLLPPLKYSVAARPCEGILLVGSCQPVAIVYRRRSCGETHRVTVPSVAQRYRGVNHPSARYYVIAGRSSAQIEPYVMNNSVHLAGQVSPIVDIGFQVEGDRL